MRSLVTEDTEGGLPVVCGARNILGFDGSLRCVSFTGCHSVLHGFPSFMCFAVTESSGVQRLEISRGKLRTQGVSGFQSLKFGACQFVLAVPHIGGGGVTCRDHEAL